MPRSSSIDLLRSIQCWLPWRAEWGVLLQGNKLLSASLGQLKSTPDLLKDQQETSPAGSSEHMKELIYAILKDG